MAPQDARKRLEQIRRNKNNKGNKPVTARTGGAVQDLRQLIGRKTTGGTNSRDSSNNRDGRLRSQSAGGVRDLRDTNRKLAARKVLTSDYRSTRGANVRLNRSFESQRTTTAAVQKPFRPTRVSLPYYVPPHLQAQQPTYIIASAPAPAPSNLAMDNAVPETQGASILISGLMPPITQSDIIELFGDIGVMTAVSMINATTALVTYRDSSDAVKAVKVYHNRLLDGKPMTVNMMPNPTAGSSVRSRIGTSSVVSSHQQHTPMEITYTRR